MNERRRHGYAAWLGATLADAQSTGSRNSVSKTEERPVQNRNRATADENEASGTAAFGSRLLFLTRQMNYSRRCMTRVRMRFVFVVVAISFVAFIAGRLFEGKYALHPGDIPFGLLGEVDSMYAQYAAGNATHVRRIPVCAACGEKIDVGVVASAAGVEYGFAQVPQNWSCVWVESPGQYSIYSYKLGVCFVVLRCKFATHLETLKDGAAADL
jgi:hypothetical protein